MAYVDDFPTDARIVRWNMGVAFLALGVGGLFGMIQALHRTGIFRGFVSSADYYTVLTGHGVLLALVFTTFALAGLFTWGVTRSLDRPLPSPRFTMSWFVLMLVGAVLAPPGSTLTTRKIWPVGRPCRAIVGDSGLLWDRGLQTRMGKFI